MKTFRCMIGLFGMALGAPMVFGDVTQEPSVSGCGQDNNMGLGYLTAPSLSPGHILRPSSIFLLPNCSREDSLDLSVDVQWANVFCYKPDQFLIDGEWVRSSARLQYGVSDPVSVGILVPVMGRTGGFADSSIEKFHETFNMGTADRDQFPRNECVGWIASNGSTQNVVRGDSWGIGDIALYAVVKRPGSETLPSVTLQFQASLPTGNEDQLEGLGASSLSVSAVTSKRLGASPLIVFGGAGFFYCPNHELAGIELYRTEYSLLLGISCEYSRSLSFVIQELSSSPVAREYYEFSESSNELSVGVKWRVGDSAILEFAVMENLFTADNSADIGAHIAVMRRL